MNSIGSLFSNTPLAISSLLGPFNVVVIVLLVLSYLRNRGADRMPYPNPVISMNDKFALLVAGIFPLLGVFGSYVFNTHNNNVMSIALLLLICFYLISMSVWRKSISDRVYPLSLLLIGISVMILLSLRSDFIIGIDTHREYYFFRKTFQAQHWEMFENNILNACLSVTLLPTVYLEFLNLESESLFKILYPLLFSISPLAVYSISRRYLTNFYSYLAAFFFISQYAYFNTAASARTNIAILFFAIFILVLFNDKIHTFKKNILLVIFAFSCVVSHYTSAYIFLGILIFMWIAVNLIYNFRKANLDLSCKLDDRDSNPLKYAGNPISIKVIASCSVIAFIWYSYVTYAPLEVGTHAFYSILTGFDEFFNVSSRGGATSLFGAKFTKGIPYVIEGISSWAAIAFIGVGIISILIKRYPLPISHKSESPFLKSKLDFSFFILSCVCSAILMVSVVVPLCLKVYDMGRLFFMMTPVLSIFFVLGGIRIAKLFQMKRAVFIILLVLIPYFAVTSGLHYQLFNQPSTVQLSSTGADYHLRYVHAGESRASSWLSNQMVEGTIIYCDSGSASRLISQGGIPPASIRHIITFFEQDGTVGHVFLRYYNVIEKLGVDSTAVAFPLNVYLDRLEVENKLYDNGYSEIWG